MIDLRNIDWGNGNARTEVNADKEHFEKIFIRISDISMLKEGHHLFLWGARGMGKSALAWNFYEECSDSQMLLKMDFEEAESWVEAALDKIVQLSKIDGFPVLKFLEDAWYQAILTEVLRRMLQKGIITHLNGKDTVHRYLKKVDAQNRNVIEALFRSIDSINTTLGKHGLVIPNPLTSTLQLAAEGFLVIEDYFKQKAGFSEVEVIFKSQLDRLPTKTLRIIVDSVDKFLRPTAYGAESNEEHRSLCLLVRGLMRALYKLHTLPVVGKKMMIKMFLPMDMKNFMKDRSYEHELVHHHNIKWRAEELGLFVAKRLLPDMDSKGNFALAMSETWEKLFPFQIENNVTGVKHSSFDYFLRHTHYRPRQMIFVGRALTEEARRLDKSTLDAKKFSSVIHEYCREASGRLLDEFKPAYPNIFDIVHRFEKSSNVISSDEIYRILAPVKLPDGIHQTSDLVQLLYDIGFFGVIKDEHHAREIGMRLPYTTAHNKTHYFLFTYLHPRFSIATENQFVIHPAFYSRFNFDINQEITIAQHANLDLEIDPNVQQSKLEI